ncbi:MAG: hypothetical protein M9930_20850, partial [Anaerolineae bacterium]|nr:hypothetical protein [Anaerolineae bacterium]
HTILTLSPLSEITNWKFINDRLPNQYLPELIASNDEKTVRTILESHFISNNAQEILLRDPFTAEDFEQFISERQRTIQEAIEQLLIKERLDLSPQLRDLDESIELVELELRSLITDGLDNDPTQIPQHIKVKVDERIQRAMRKNAALDAEYYQTLAGKLEFFDLRELQDTIVSKALWPIFETRFSNKVALVTKFDQLAELRNCIRHSRKVDKITQKEGEAAILWFEQVLQKVVI